MEPTLTAAEPGPRRKRQFQPKAIIGLTVIWLVLVGEVSLVNVVGGVLIALGITLVFPLPPVRHEGRLHLRGAAVLVLHLFKDLAVASLRLAGYSFSRRVPSPGIIRINLRSDSDLYQVITAELCSVVPGTIVVDARGSRRHLYLHVFHLPDQASRDAVIRDTLALERRVVHTLGSRSEIDALDRAGDQGEAGSRPEV